MSKVKVLEIKERVRKIFLALGFDEERANIVCEVLTDTEIKGLKTHGYLRVSRYAKCVRGGGIIPMAEIKRVVDLPSIALLDASHSHGIVASYKATELAIEKAKNTGVGLVAVRGSRHFGAAGYYTEMCAKQGMLGISMSNGDIMIAPTGACEKAIGNNPMSYAAPAGKYNSIVYDIAMSMGSDMKIIEMSKKGVSAPDGWMIDQEGRPTNNPNDYLNGGVLLPFGGYKGYGLALMVECFASALANASITKDASAWCATSDGKGDVGHMFLAVDISKFDSVEEYSKRIEKMIDDIKASKRAQGVDSIYYPGEKEHISRALCLSDGEVDVADATLSDIDALEVELGLK